MFEFACETVQTLGEQFGAVVRGDRDAELRSIDLRSRQVDEIRRRRQPGSATPDLFEESPVRRCRSHDRGLICFERGQALAGALFRVVDPGSGAVDAASQGLAGLLRLVHSFVCRFLVRPQLGQFVFDAASQGLAGLLRLVHSFVCRFLVRPQLGQFVFNAAQTAFGRVEGSVIQLEPVVQFARRRSEAVVHR